MNDNTDTKLDINARVISSESLSVSNKLTASHGEFDNILLTNSHQTSNSEGKGPLLFQNEVKLCKVIICLFDF